MRARLQPLRDPRLIEYICISAASIAVALLAGVIWPAAVGAAAMALVLIGLRRPQPLDVHVEVTYNAQSLIEGDRIQMAVTVEHPPGYEIDIAFPTAGPYSPLGEAHMTARQRRPISTSITVARDAVQWGYHPAGTVMVRATVPNSVIHWELEITDPAGVRVLPTPTRLTELLNPPASQATAGSHPARIITGDGVDFVDIREYRIGDRVRDINWKATARRHMPHINRRRPERGGDVVIVVDALPDAGWVNSVVGRQLLVRAGQATWALVRNHLSVQDRVGLVVRRHDGVIHLAPSGGTRAQYQLLDALLSANAQRPTQPVIQDSGDLIPSAALTVAVSSLSSARSMRSVVAIAANGRTTGLLALAPDDYLTSVDSIDSSTARLASMAFDARIAYIRRAGIPVVEWNPNADLNRVVSRLGEMTRRTLRRGVT